jgi:hypothetical protein
MSYTYEWADAEQTTLKRICSEHGECAYIPTDPGNTDYQEYLAWLAEGNEPLPTDEPPTD